MTIRYIGLDFEATGSDPWKGNVPIQIGLTTGYDDYVSLIGGWGIFGAQTSQYEWSEEAFGVHGITREEVYAAPPVWVVDIEAAAFLIDQVGYKNRMFTVPVGWNVAGYDRQFITRWMPNLDRLLSYRTVDLNALVFAKAGGDEGAYVGWKKQAKDYAEARVGGKRHNALVDARAALYEFEFLSGRGA